MQTGSGDEQPVAQVSHMPAAAAPADARSNGASAKVEGLPVALNVAGLRAPRAGAVVELQATPLRYGDRHRRDLTGRQRNAPGVGGLVVETGDVRLRRDGRAVVALALRRDAGPEETVADVRRGVVAGECRGRQPPRVDATRWRRLTGLGVTR